MNVSQKKKKSRPENESKDLTEPKHVKIDTTLERLKNRSAADGKSITHELLKYCRKALKEQLLSVLINKIIKENGIE